MGVPKNITVKDFLTQAIEASGLKQTEIALAVGYDKPNFITMLKQGKTKLPINKVPVFAKALGIDELHFLRLVMREYHPQVWGVFENIMGKQLIADDEFEIVKIMREQAEGQPLHPNEEERAELRALIQKIAARK
jgi:transcriptional regulator with XRE-family HTH domain